MTAVSCCRLCGHADHVLTHKTAHPVRLVAVEEVLGAHRARGQVPALVVCKLGQVHAAVALHAVAGVQAKPGATAAQIAVWAVINLHGDTRHDSGRAGAGICFWPDQLARNGTAMQYHAGAMPTAGVSLTCRPGTSSQSLQMPQKYAASFSPHPLHSPARCNTDRGMTAMSSQEQKLAFNLACPLGLTCHRLLLAAVHARHRRNGLGVQQVVLCLVVAVAAGEDAPAAGGHQCCAPRIVAAPECAAAASKDDASGPSQLDKHVQRRVWEQKQKHVWMAVRNSRWN